MPLMIISFLLDISHQNMFFLYKIIKYCYHPVAVGDVNTEKIITPALGVSFLVIVVQLGTLN